MKAWQDLGRGAFRVTCSEYNVDVTRSLVCKHRPHSYYMQHYVTLGAKAIVVQQNVPQLLLHVTVVGVV